ncbi:LGFP repeat-containing protein [Paenibacillus sacheonensis]|uniref:Uncharacterized protein n=1 Tax=Paenibacillus sacheonensis TaxID=742054 RepID=A0A7X4YPX9_9BACL|nr:hypothetical protein [Paenibacillus sacheonensis]MBM7566101.1 hypothetical protein [Paenibacillus sacheonensis]NBC70315.1 hypothetical protein [Paenibacillus sacheonensis]
MADKCVGGTFDGNTLVTARDRELCVQGTGVVQSDGSTSGGGCAGDTVKNFAAADNHALNTTAIYAARGKFGYSQAVKLLTQLSSAARPTVDSIVFNDPKLSARVVEGLGKLTELSAQALHAAPEDQIYAADTHEYFANLARDVADHTNDEHLKRLVNEAITTAVRFVGIPLKEIITQLGPAPELGHLPESVEHIELQTLFDADLVISSKVLRSDFLPIDATLFHSRFSDARIAIEAKARSLGALASQPAGKLRSAGGGFVQRYADCDIYYTPETGAHEVHGEIRNKYLAVNGPVLLGLPTTDESICPDGIGRFNHFQKSASIYWTPRTGPFYLMGSVRFRWASEGWETGRLGYPVTDQYSLTGLYPPEDNPDMHWSKFENGMVFAHGSEALVALAAEVSESQVRDAIYKTFDRKMKTKTVALGLISVEIRPGLYGVDAAGVGDWSYGFWSSVPRTLKLRVRGFVSLPVVSDPTWEVEVDLRFVTTSPLESFTYPQYKTVLAALQRWSVRVHGVLADTIRDEIVTALTDAFQSTPTSLGSLVLGDLPTGVSQRGTGKIDVLDIMLAADGSLQIFVNPLPDLEGRFRKLIAQSKLDSLIADF